MKTKHVPVLLQPIIDSLQPINDGVYIDATLGGGGHSKEILKNLKSGELTAFDISKEACEEFERQIPELNINKNVRVRVINTNFKNIDEYISNKGKVSGIIADLGFSTDQLEQVKGLSFLNDQELDMRMDPTLTVKASDLLNGLYAKELENLFWKYGDIRFAKKLAESICKVRAVKPINKTNDLNLIIQRIVPFGLRKGDNKHPEAKVYQALRIAVNDELNSLNSFLGKGFDLLGPGGKFAIITFHSGEDKIVKSYFGHLVDVNLARFVARLIKPSDEEIKLNKNSRSAHLRVIEKL